jgi:hypothetical protein
MEYSRCEEKNTNESAKPCESHFDSAERKRNLPNAVGTWKFGWEVFVARQEE